MAKKQVNVAMIGHSFMGKAHSNAYRQAPHFFPLDVEPVMKVIVGIDEKDVRPAAEELGWQEWSIDWEEVVNRPDIDLVDVATPNNLHPMISQAALKAGKHVLCEKPLATTLEDAKASYEVAKASGRINAISHNYRRAPAIALAQKLVAEGKLGKIHHFRGTYLQDWLLSPSVPLVWRLDRKISGSGAHGDLNAHLIDTARFVLGSEFSEVVGMEETFVKQRPLVAETQGGLSGFKASDKMGEVTVDDATAFLARFENGAMGTFEASRFAAGRKNFNRWEINGEKGSIAFNLERMNEIEVFFTDDPVELQGFRSIPATQGCHPYMKAYWPVAHIIGYEHTFVNMIADLMQAIAHDTPFKPDFLDGYRSQAVLAAVERSSASRAWVSASI